jgi:hypothetical protein
MVLKSAVGCSIENSILWHNRSEVGLGLTFGSTIQIEFSDVQSGSLAVYVADSSSFYWGEGNIDADPVFFSGALSNYQLTAGLSPCIDAGNPDPEFNDPEDPANPGYALWPALGGLRNDMGAYGGGGVGYWVGIEGETEPPAPGECPVVQVYPNPSQGSSMIAFEVTQPSEATLQVHDLSGRLVETLFEGEMVSGPMYCFFDGGGLPSGVYVVLLRTETSTATRRLVLLR